MHLNHLQRLTCSKTALIVRHNLASYFKYVVLLHNVIAIFPNTSKRYPNSTTLRPTAFLRRFETSDDKSVHLTILNQYPIKEMLQLKKSFTD